MLTARIPQALREAVQAEAADFKGSELAAATAALSQAYRAGLPARLDSALARAAYLVTRLPATFAALSAALRELPFEPESWLDLGAGPGTAAWLAACPITLVEQNEAWQEYAEADWIQADLRRLPDLAPHDLVTICYALNELADRDRARLLDEAWRLARRALLVLEPGTQPGFDIVRAARTQLLVAGAHIHAPCPHAGVCPMAAGDWCHFAVRVERSKEHRLAKGGALSYEDEKYSYALFLKEPAPPAAPARILRHPNTQPHVIEFTLCTESAGIQPARITKKQASLWKRARKADWGGAWEDAHRG